jgi:endo-1,4-beta-xylanase
MNIGKPFKNYQAIVFVGILLPFMILTGFYSCFSGTTKGILKSDTTTSLCSVYKDFFKIGVAVSSHRMTDSLYTSIIRKQFNSITAENAMKWEKIHPAPGRYNFQPVDSFVDFGEANNMYIVGHVLVWHQQTPEWVFKDASGKPATRDTLLKRMHDHIETVVSRYKGRVNCWDVVNEAVDDNGEIRKNNWYNIIGIDYVQKAFEYAHEADSNAVLIYNDYSLPNPVKRDGVVKLICDLKSNGVKIDVIGMQGHYHLDYPDLGDLEQSIMAFAGLGCKVMFTEFDINMLPMPDFNQGADIALNFKYDKRLNPYPDALSDSMQTVLANRYSDFFKIFIKHADIIERVTIWGVEDGGSWLNYWPVHGRSNYPLLFDRNHQPKPAYWSIIRLARESKKPEEI